MDGVVGVYALFGAGGVEVLDRAGRNVDFWYYRGTSQGVVGGGERVADVDGDRGVLVRPFLYQFIMVEGGDWADEGAAGIDGFFGGISEVAYVVYPRADGWEGASVGGFLGNDGRLRFFVVDGDEALDDYSHWRRALDVVDRWVLGGL